MREYFIGGALAFLLYFAVFLLGVQVGCIWGANEMKYQLTPHPRFDASDELQSFPLETAGMQSVLEQSDAEKEEKTEDEK
ncbi:MAG: hypothetical protein E7029_10020 [Planctomycetaceae bacterium]|nr:hypothetical protein [Planctomycetaceae bacterium]